MPHDKSLPFIMFLVFASVSCIAFLTYLAGKHDANAQVVAKCLQDNENKPLIDAKKICRALIEN